MVEGIHEGVQQGAGSAVETTAPSRRTLVIDFDGTITERETLALLVERFGDPEAQRRAEAELGRTLTLHDVIARGYASLLVSPDVALRWAAEHVAFRPGFRALVDLARDRGWRLVIVSSGLRDLIEPLLAREGLTGLEVVSNELGPAGGWEVAFRDDEACPVCGEACKRRTVTALADGGEVVYVGDGYSDGCAALAADRVFARRRLVEYLGQRGAAFEPFDDFHDIAAALAD